MATILDIRQLSELKIVTIDEKNQVTISARDSSPLPLTPKEASQLHTFLSVNEPRLEAACGGIQIQDRLLVWESSHGKMLWFPLYASVWPTVERNPGRAYLFAGTVPEVGVHYGGLTSDGSQFMLIPSELHDMRFRELLVEACRKQVGGDNLYLLASVVSTEEILDDPISAHPSQAAEAAHEGARQVDYWLQIARPK